MRARACKHACKIEISIFNIATFLSNLIYCITGIEIDVKSAEINFLPF